MTPTPLWIYLYLYVPLLLLLIFSGYFYCRAIKHSGLEKLKKFTGILLGFFVAIVILASFKFDIFHWVEYLPFSFLDEINNNVIRLTLIFGVIIYFSISAKLIWNERRSRFLMIAWLIIAVFNITPVLLNAYYYLTWMAPPPMPPAKTLPEQIILDHYMGPEVYLYNMIRPFCWLAISSISLLKIRKETQRTPAMQMP